MYRQHPQVPYVPELPQFMLQQLQPIEAPLPPQNFAWDSLDFLSEADKDSLVRKFSCLHVPLYLELMLLQVKHMEQQSAEQLKHMEQQCKHMAQQFKQQMEQQVAELARIAEVEAAEREEEQATVRTFDRYVRRINNILAAADTGTCRQQFDNFDDTETSLEECLNEFYEDISEHASYETLRNATIALLDIKWGGWASAPYVRRPEPHPRNAVWNLRVP